MERNTHEALWLLHYAAEQGHVKAQSFLRNLNDRASQLRRSCGLHTYADAKYHLCLAGDSEDDEDLIGGLERLEQLHVLADRGDVEAQTDLGDLYCAYPYLPSPFSVIRGPIATAERVAGDRGDGNEVGVKWYAKAARRGYAEAQFKLGVMYAELVELGEDEEQNNKRALKWKVRAALNGSLEAQRNLDLLEYLLEGRDDNYIGDYVGHLRSGWNGLGAEFGSSGAKCQFAQAYAMGMGGVPKDFTEALKWLLRAVEEGSTLASRCLERPFDRRTWQAKLQEYRRAELKEIACTDR